MELGISMFGDLGIDPVTGQHQASQQRIKDLIEEIKLADEVGLDAFGIGEHHRADYVVSNPEIILAAAATVTKHIKLGSAVTVLSSADPVRVYQNFATVDLLSERRAEITAGRGSFIESFPLFGYDTRNYNELFEEKLGLLLKLNEEETINWKGKLHPAIKGQVMPRAQRRLPVWIAVGGTPESVERAARLGLPMVIALIGGDPKNFAPYFDFYRRVYAENGHDPAQMQLGLHSHCFVGEDDSVADTYFPVYSAQMRRIGAERGWPSYSRAQYDASRAKGGSLFVGDVHAVTDKILEVQELFGLTRFMAHVDVGGPSHKELMKAIELFGTKVAPAVKKAVGNK